MNRPAIICLLAALAFLASAARLSAIFAAPKEVPAAELITGLETFVKKHPDSAEGLYRLGRAHYLVYTLRSKFVGIYLKKAGDPDVLPDIAIDMFEPGNPSPDRWLPGGPPKDPRTPEELAAAKSHLRDALKLLRQAVEKDAKNARYHLVLGCAMEQAAAFPDEMGALPELPELQKRGHLSAEGWRHTAAGEYLQAYNLALPSDLARPNKPITGVASLLSYSAGKHYLALNAKPDDQNENLVKNIDEVKHGVEKLDNLPPGPK